MTYSVDLPSGQIQVTRPFLPPLEEIIPLLEKIWERRWLTNNGPLHTEFEAALAAYLGVRYVSLFCNGMLALQVGLQALEVTGEVITTPFSFIATTHAIQRNGCIPVFGDIEPETFTLDPEKIECLITSKTTAILPVHVYGNPCKVAQLQKIAEKYNLRLFYDAAHAFGVQIKGESILNFGDLSMLSFHATKVFNTFEGGALITNDENLKQKIDHLKNFGLVDEETIIGLGTNGKMNEFQAALGLVQLRYIEEVVENRRRVFHQYREGLKSVKGIAFLEDLSGVKHNYSYFPLLIDSGSYGCGRDAVWAQLKQKGIYGRRYFYPLISQFPFYSGLASARPGTMPVAERAAETVICLPVYPDLEDKTIDDIVAILRTRLK